MYKVSYKGNDSREWGEILVIETEDGVIAEHEDGGEPEDRYFCRDWSWVKSELERAYQKGLKDGVATPPAENKGE